MQDMTCDFRFTPDIQTKLARSLRSYLTPSPVTLFGLGSDFWLLTLHWACRCLIQKYSDKRPLPIPQIIIQDISHHYLSMNQIAQCLAFIAALRVWSDEVSGFIKLFKLFYDDTYSNYSHTR